MRIYDPKKNLELAEKCDNIVDKLFMMINKLPLNENYILDMKYKNKHEVYFSSHTLCKEELIIFDFSYKIRRFIINKLNRKIMKHMLGFKIINTWFPPKLVWGKYIIVKS